VKRTVSKYWIVAVVAAAAAIVYLPALRGEFVEWDDAEYVAENFHIRALNLAFLKWAFLGFHASNWHPLTWVSHALDFAFWGLHPAGHHLTSVILHALNTLLVGLLAARWVEAGGGLGRRGAITAGAVTAALFGLHPAHVESVAWVSERKDVLCAFFFLLSLLFHASFAERAPEPGRRALRDAAGPYALSLACFALAILSKPMAVSLPAVLLILDAFPFGRIRSRRSAAGALVEKIPFLLLAAGSSVAAVLAQRAGGALTWTEAIPLSTRLLVAAGSVAGYLGKLLFPLHLLPYYPYPAGVSLSSPRYFVPASAVLALGLAAAIYARWRPMWAAAGAYYLVTLLPVIGLVQVGSQGMADRYTYLPLTGIFVAVAWSLARSAGHHPGLRAPLALACGAALLTLACLTSRQVSLWRDTRTLFSHALSLSSENAMAHNTLGIWLSSEGRFEEALDQYREAVRMVPWNAELVFNRGTALEALGNLPAAESSYRRALELDQNYSQAWNNLGMVFGKLDRNAEAAIAYQRALIIDPRLPQAHFNLGALLASQGKIDEAIDRYRTTLEIDPGSYHAHTNLGVIFAGQGRFQEAVVQFRAAIERDPQNAAAHRNLGNALLALGDRKGAAAEFEKAQKGETTPASAQSPAPPAGAAGPR